MKSPTGWIIRSFLYLACLLAMLFLLAEQGSAQLANLNGPVPQFFSTAGLPLTGGKLYSYQAGTSTPLATYSDAAGTVLNSNPIILNVAGFPVNGSGAPTAIFLKAQAYKLTLKDSLGVQIWSIDNLTTLAPLGMPFLSGTLANRPTTCIASITFFVQTDSPYTLFQCNSAGNGWGAVSPAWVPGALGTAGQELVVNPGATGAVFQNMQWKDIRAFGCSPALADNATCLQAALTSFSGVSGGLFCPAGVYAVKSMLTYTGDGGHGFIFAGAGGLPTGNTSACVLQYTGTATANPVLKLFRPNGVILRDIAIDANNLATGGVQLDQDLATGGTGGSGNYLENVSIYSMAGVNSYGVKVGHDNYQLDNTHLTNVSINGNNPGGIATYCFWGAGTANTRNYSFTGSNMIGCEYGIWMGTTGASQIWRTNFGLIGTEAIHAGSGGFLDIGGMSFENNVTALSPSRPTGARILTTTFDVYTTFRDSYFAGTAPADDYLMVLSGATTLINSDFFSLRLAGTTTTSTDTTNLYCSTCDFVTANIKANDVVRTNHGGLASSKVTSITDLHHLVISPAVTGLTSGDAFAVYAPTKIQCGGCDARWDANETHIESIGNRYENTDSGAFIPIYNTADTPIFNVGSNSLWDVTSRGDQGGTTGLGLVPLASTDILSTLVLGSPGTVAAGFFSAAGQGTIRMTKNVDAYFDNNANSGDVKLFHLDASDRVELGGAAGIVVTAATINGGAAITKHLTGSAALDFGNLAAIGCEDLTIAVTGAADGDPVKLGVPNASVVNSTAIFSAWVSASSTVTVRYCNLVSGDPASGTFTVVVGN